MRKLIGLVGLLLVVAGLAGVWVARGSMPAQAGPAPWADGAALPVCGPGTWTARAPMPVSGAFMATAAQGGRLYTFGGSGNGFSYNPTSNTWTAIAPLPANRSYTSAVSDGTYLYVLNGSDGSGPQNSLFRYDPATDSYTTLAAPPIAIDEQAAVYLNGKIYRIAGSVNATQTASVDVYTVSTNTWAPPGSVADYPQALGGLNAVASGGYIYAAGGADQVQSVVSNKTYRYDPATNTWDDTAVPDLPMGRYEGAGDVLDGYWILAGGYAWDYQVSTNVITLDLSNPSGGWTGRAWQPLWRWALGGATVGSAFYTVGGLDWSIQSQADTEQYTLTFCAPTPTGTAPTATRTGTRPPTGTPPSCGTGIWSQQSPYPVPVGGGAMAAQGGVLYNFGGAGNGVPDTDTYAYYPGIGTWGAMHPLPVALEGAAAVSDGTYLYIAGGINFGGQTSAAFYRYDPVSNTYTTLAPAPIDAYDQGLAYLNGKIYRIAGSQGVLGQGTGPQPGAALGKRPDWTVLNEVDVYTISTGTWSTVAPYPQHVEGLVAVGAGGYVYAGGGTVAGGKTYRYDPASNTWDDAAVTDLPEDHYVPASAILNGRWVIAGNGSNPLTSNVVVALDLANPSGSWTPLPPLPLARAYADGGAIGSHFFVVGGFSNVNNPSATQNTQQYQESYCPPPATPSWTPTPLPATATRTATPPPSSPSPTPTCAPGLWRLDTAVPQAAEEAAAIALGGKVYTFGGWGSGGGAAASAYKYDPATSTWTRLADLPAPRAEASAVTNGTYIYILGGAATGPTNTLWRYDPATDTYTTLAPAALAITAHTSAYLAGRIYRISGQDATGRYTPSVEVYTIATNTWAAAADYPLATGYLAAIADGPYLYTAGGERVASNKTYRYDPVSNTWDDAAIADLPTDRGFTASGLVNGRWILAGGIAAGAITNSVITWDPVGNTWTSLPAMPHAQRGPAGAVIGSSLFAVGGWDPNSGSVSTDVQEYFPPPCLPPTATRTATPPPVVTASPTATATCEPAWSTVANPGSSYLSAVSAHAADDVWAVGGSEIEHWDGHAWSIVPSPSVPAAAHGLFGVAAVSANDVWAAGDTYLNGLYQTLIEHWDGHAWTIVPSPNVGDDNNTLWGEISATGPDDVWAVGTYADVNGGRTLIEHWDGHQWSVVPSPNASACTNDFSSVAALAPSNAWAVGMYTPDGDCSAGYQSLVEHWDGSQWNIVTVPDIGPLTGVAGSAANDVWVTGLSQALHWDGSGWHAMPLPAGTDGRGTTMIDFGVNNAWLLGSTNQNSPVAEHWDGSQWSIAATFNDVDALYGIAAVGPQDLWAVGAESVIEHYVASCSTPAPTATSVPPSPTGTPTSLPANPSPTGTPGAPSPTGTPPSPSPIGTACAVTFSDVHPTDYFYEPVQYLACRGVISGYADHSFRPYANTTRAQMVKIVVLGFSRPLATPTAGGYTFADVPPGTPFFDVIETAAAGNIVGGYGCGGPGEPCDGQHRRYFRPNTNVTRGQLSKIDVLTAGWGLQNPATPTFSDVPPGSAFYEFVETAVAHGIISGYADHTFRPNSPATRGQISKIVYLSLSSPQRR